MLWNSSTSTPTTAVRGDTLAPAGAEARDDANMDDTDACTSACVNAVCGGNNVREPGEQCDDGNMDDTDACTNICK